MALRSLDNTLPAALTERPKKIAKTAAIAPPRRSSVNDENMLPPPPVAAAAAVAPPPTSQPNPTPTADSASAIEYIPSADLKPLEDPQAKIENLLAELDSKDWSKICEALNDVRRLVLFHSSVMLPLLDKIMSMMVKAMKNPRSALCKTAIMASTDIFSSYGGTLLSTSGETAFDELLLQLLLKASQDKRFVCEEAERALEKMSCSLLPIPLLGKLHLHVKHTNQKVRAKAAVSISTCVFHMGVEAMKEFGLPILLAMAAKLLNDKLPEAREAARSITNAVFKAFMEDVKLGGDEQPSALECWQSFCSSNLDPLSAQSIMKITKQ